MTDDSSGRPATKLTRRRTLRLSGVAAVGSLAALAGCGDEGPGEEEEQEPGEPEADEPEEEPAEPEGDDPEDDPTEEEPPGDGEDGSNGDEDDEGGA